MGFETPEEGYLAKVFIEAGTRDIPIGKLLCIIVEEQEDVAKFADFDASSAVEAAAPAAPAPATPAAAAPAPPPPAAVPAAAPVQRSAPVAGGKVFASPAAKRVAAEKGIDLSQIKSGSGMDGMITSKVSFILDMTHIKCWSNQDVESFKPAASAATPSLLTSFPAASPQDLAGSGVYSDAEASGIRYVRNGLISVHCTSWFYFAQESYCKKTATEQTRDSSLLSHCGMQVISSIES